MCQLGHRDAAHRSVTRATEDVECLVGIGLPGRAVSGQVGGVRNLPAPRDVCQLAAEVMAKINDVRSEVGKCAAAEIRLLLPANAAGGINTAVVPIRKLKRKNAPEPPLVDQSPRPHDGGEKAVVEYHSANHAMLVRQSTKGLGLGHGQGQGLFAQNVLARQNGIPCHLKMERIGGADVDNVNIWVGDHRGRIGVCARNAESLCRRPCALLCGGTNGKDLGGKSRLLGVIEKGKLPHRMQVCLAHKAEPNKSDS